MIIALSGQVYSQGRPSLQINAGLTFPQNGLSGELVMTNDSGISNVTPEFIRDNYGASTGASINITLKFPLSQNSIFSFLMSGSYSSFNAFRQSKLGVTVVDNAVVPANFDSKFSATTFAFGLEVSPFSGSVISPYVNSSLALNFLSLTLIRNEFSGAIFNDAFRMGAITTGGLAFNLNTEYSLLLGMSYNFSNLLLKSHSGNFSDGIAFNRDNLPINDQEGSFYTNLSDPNSFPVIAEGKTKNINWLSFSLGINIVLGKSPRK